MDNREVALELLKLFLEMRRERVEIDELVDAYLYILDILEHGHQERSPQPPPPHPGTTTRSSTSRSPFPSRTRRGRATPPRWDRPRSPSRG
ncbi:TPA: hypothetical protein EYP13_02655 [Candidatus Micrarchaeota archaeon]|nr:hypothetical protein [Candidatus Micrarchaeota archaeon]